LIYIAFCNIIILIIITFIIYLVKLYYAENNAKLLKDIGENENK